MSSAYVTRLSLDPVESAVDVGPNPCVVVEGPSTTDCVPVTFCELSHVHVWYGVLPAGIASSNQTTSAEGGTGEVATGIVHGVMLTAELFVTCPRVALTTVDPLVTFCA